MNKPYTCHVCGTVFDAWPDELDEHLSKDPTTPPPQKVKVKCPGCYLAGFTGIGQDIFTIDISGDAVLSQDS